MRSWPVCLMSILARLSKQREFQRQIGRFVTDETPVGYAVPLTVIIVVAVVV